MNTLTKSSGSKYLLCKTNTIKQNMKEGINGQTYKNSKFQLIQLLESLGVEIDI